MNGGNSSSRGVINALLLLLFVVDLLNPGPDVYNENDGNRRRESLSRFSISSLSVVRPVGGCGVCVCAEEVPHRPAPSPEPRDEPICYGPRPEFIVRPPCRHRRPSPSPPPKCASCCRTETMLAIYCIPHLYLYLYIRTPTLQTIGFDGQFA